MAQSTDRNVIEIVVDRNLCVGCGTCAGVCPAKCLRIEFNRFGEYAPTEIKGCAHCGVCLRVCPFVDENRNEDEIGREVFGGIPGIGHSPECGYHLGGFAGCSEVGDHRARGASGGLATWMLETLLTRGIVDKVIAVRPNSDPDKLFEYAVIGGVEELRGCAGSAYYPVEMSGVLEHVIENEGRYAVIGLPCFIKALRLASAANPKLRERLVFHAGLVCEMLHSRFFAEYMVTVAGGDPKSVRSVSFRAKDPNLSARDAVFTYRTDPGSVEPDGSTLLGRVCGQVGGGAKWLFRLNSCNYCDDIFAEGADAVFMDAWLPEYEADPRGTSLALARSPLAADLIRSGMKNKELAVGEISIEKLISSQRPVLRMKREDLALRLYLARNGGGEIPKKRVEPAADPASGEVRAQRRMMSFQREGRQAWAKTRGKGIDAFYREMPSFRAGLRHEKFLAVKGRVLGGVMKRASRGLALLRGSKRRAV